jgi:hypothetical protein
MSLSIFIRLTITVASAIDFRLNTLRIVKRNHIAKMPLHPLIYLGLGESVVSRVQCL